MVSVFYDKESLYSRKKDLIVSDFKEYVDAYVKIIAAIRNQEDIIVITTNMQIYVQLGNLKEFYPREIKQREFSIREDFREKYDIEIPTYITEQDLSKDKTFLEIDFTSGESFENVILRKYFDGFFIGKKFPFQLLPEMCLNLNFSQVKNKEHLILRKVFQYRMKQYKAELCMDYEKFIFEEILNNFDSLKTDIALYLIIKDYPREFKEDILGKDMIRCMEYFRIDGKSIKMDSTVEKSYKDRAIVFLNDEKVDFFHVLTYVSGIFPFELEIVLNKIKNPSEKDIDMIIKKFNELFEKNSREKDRLLTMKAPVKLVSPEFNDSIDSWMKWALENYLPYRFWLELSGRNDDDADKYASMYADWIFENYDRLINSYPNMMCKILPSLKDDFISNEHSLIVILDNFNYKFVPELTEYLNAYGFNKLNEKPVLAMIPTETAISKRAFFTGEAYNDNKQGYDKLVKNWSNQIGVSMRYLSNVGALRGLTSFDEKVVFLNYLQIDDILHQDQSNSAQSIEYRIKQELKALINQIVSTLKKLGREKDTDIYFISDHGSTKITSEQINVIDPKYYKEKAGESDYRFITVTDEDFENTKDAIGALCYALDKKRYGIQNNIFIARRYNRFIRNEMRGYVHGGVTPEESIVPFMHFAFDIAQCKNPEVTLGNELLRFSVSTKLSIMVKNFNEFNLNDVSLTIQNSNIKYLQPKSINIDAYGTCLIEIPNTRITKALDRKNNENMTLKISYSANGRKHNYTVELAMPMKSVQSLGSDLSDLF